jgi:putative acetyltransferase
MLIKSDSLDNPDVQHLFHPHFTELRSQGHPETSFALNLSFPELEITLYTAWEGNSLLGWGALNHLSLTHRETKLMRTVQGHLLKARTVSRAKISVYNCHHLRKDKYIYI